MDLSIRFENFAKFGCSYFPCKALSFIENNAHIASACFFIFYHMESQTLTNGNRKSVLIYKETWATYEMWPVENLLDFTLRGHIVK